MCAELNPTLRTSTVVALVAEIDRGDTDYHLLPILADSLQDAGCTDADLLTDLRSKSATPRVCVALRFYA